MQADADIVGRQSEMCRDSLPRLLFEIGALDDLGIVRPESRHEVPDAAARIILLVCAGLKHRLRSLDFVRGLRPLPRRATAVIVGQGIAQNAAEPGIDLAAVARRLRSPDHLEAKILEGDRKSTRLNSSH